MSLVKMLQNVKALHKSLRLLLYMVGDFQGKVKHMDVSTASLYGKYSKQIYFKLPNGHPKKRGKHNVWKSRT